MLGVSPNSFYILWCWHPLQDAKKKTVPTHLRQVILSVGQLVWVPVYSSKGQLNIYKYVGHKFLCTFFWTSDYNIACSFSSFQLAQRTSRVKSGTRETEDSLAHWTSGSQLFFLALALPFPESLRKLLSLPWNYTHYIWLGVHSLTLVFWLTLQPVVSCIRWPNTTPSWRSLAISSTILKDNSERQQFIHATYTWQRINTCWSRHIKTEIWIIAEGVGGGGGLSYRSSENSYTSSILACSSTFH